VGALVDHWKLAPVQETLTDTPKGGGIGGPAAKLRDDIRKTEARPVSTDDLRLEKKFMVISFHCRPVCSPKRLTCQSR
jgi:hypothetical protein